MAMKSIPSQGHVTLAGRGTVSDWRVIAVAGEAEAPDFGWARPRQKTQLGGEGVMAIGHVMLRPAQDLGRGAVAVWCGQ